MEFPGLALNFMCVTPQNLQQCFEKALRLKASLQLYEGVNMAQKTTVRNVDLDGDGELNLIKDARARSNVCYKCGEERHFQTHR